MIAANTSIAITACQTRATMRQNLPWSGGRGKAVSCAPSAPFAGKDLAPPRAPSRAGCQLQVITPLAVLIETELRSDVSLKGSVIYESLVAEHSFTGHCQRVEMHLATVRPLSQDELFETDDNALRRFAPPVRRRRRRPGPGQLGRTRRCTRPRRDGTDLLVPHDAVLLPESVYVLHIPAGHRDVLGRPAPAVRALRWGPGLDRLQPTKTVIKRHVAPGNRPAASAGGASAPDAAKPSPHSAPNSPRPAPATPTPTSPSPTASRATSRSIERSHHVGSSGLRECAERHPTQDRADRRDWPCRN